MALTPVQRRMQAILERDGAFNAPIQKPPTAPIGTSFRSLTPAQQRMQEILDRDRMVPSTNGLQAQSLPPEEGLLSKATSLVQRGVTGFTNLPVIKQAGQVAGGAIAIPSAAIGGVVGAVGTPMANIIKGKPIFQDIGRNIMQSGKEAGQFGYSIGSQAPVVGTLGAIGKIPAAIVGASDVYRSSRMAREAYQSGDLPTAVEAGVTAGLGAVGLGLAAKGSSASGEIKTLPGRAKAKMAGIPFPEYTVERAQSVMRDVIQPSKATVTREAKGFLAEARAEREGRKINLGQPVERTLVEEGIIPKTKTEGGAVKFDTTDQAIVFDDAVNRVNSILENDVLPLKPEKQFDLEALKKNSVSSVDKLKNVSAKERLSMKEEVVSYFDAEIVEMGRMVDGTQLNRIKRGMANAGDYKNLSPGQKHIRDASSIIGEELVRGYKDVEQVGKINKILGNYIQARDRLLDINGRVLRGGGLNRKLTSLTASLAVGGLCKVPILGELIGYKLGQMLNDYSLSPERRLSGPFADVEKSRFVPESSKLLQKYSKPNR